jgi:hypothetical protein
MRDQPDSTNTTMKATSITIKPVALAALALAAFCLPVGAEDDALPPAADKAEKLEKHKVGSQKLAVDQDELSADVQELIEEQTADNVIVLLEEVEEIMAEVTGSLDESETGGETLAAETEIIEKIFEAAKQRQQGGT